MSKTSKDKDTYKHERAPRTKRRKVEQEREREVVIPSRQQINKLRIIDKETD